MMYDKAYSFLIQKLEEELPAYLVYHNAAHTKDVIKAVQYLGRAEGVSEEDMILLCTAALFHDAGFLKSYKDHEEWSCELAKTYLPQFDYNEQQIEQICEMIRATKMPNAPGTRLASILCDADLYYLGSDQYFNVAENLYKELKKTGQVKSRTEWKRKQLQFLQSHQFFTQTANKEQSLRKEQHLFALKTGKGRTNKYLKNEHIIQEIQDFFLIVIGVIITGFALKGFLVPNHFFDGGITGISLLLHELYHINLAYVIVAANLPLIILSYFTVGRRFAFKTFICVLLLGIGLLYHYPIITSDKLLISIFGGFFLGIGIGLTMRAGCALDGVEVLALYTLKRTSFTITEIIMGINVLIFAVAAFEFGMETALYSILTYFTATKTIDYIVEGLEAYTGVTIISGHSETIKHKLVNEMGRGITVYKGERGFLPGKFEISSPVDIIFTVVTRLELRKLKNLVYETDPQAFVFANTIREASGGILKRKAAH